MKQGWRYMLSIMGYTGNLKLVIGQYHHIKANRVIVLSNVYH